MPYLSDSISWKFRKYVHSVGYCVLKYLSQEVLTPCVPPRWDAYVSDVTVSKVRCLNDDKQAIYRLVTFSALGERYFLITNVYLTAYLLLIHFKQRRALDNDRIPQPLHAAR